MSTIKIDGTFLLWQLANVWLDQKWHSGMIKESTGLPRSSQSCFICTLTHCHCKRMEILHSGSHDQQLQKSYRLPEAELCWWGMWGSVGRMASQDSDSTHQEQWTEESELQNEASSGKALKTRFDTTDSRATYYSVMSCSTYHLI